MSAIIFSVMSIVGHHILCHVHSGLFRFSAMSTVGYRYSAMSTVGGGQILCHIHRVLSDSLPWPYDYLILCHDHYGLQMLWRDHCGLSDALPWPLWTIRCSAVTTVDYQMFCHDHSGLSDSLPWLTKGYQDYQMFCRDHCGLSDVLPWPQWIIRFSARAHNSGLLAYWCKIFPVVAQ
jgi:hypothetical protein